MLVALHVFVPVPACERFHRCPRCNSHLHHIGKVHRVVSFKFTLAQTSSAALNDFRGYLGIFIHFSFVTRGQIEVRKLNLEKLGILHKYESLGLLRRHVKVPIVCGMVEHFVLCLLSIGKEEMGHTVSHTF